MNNRLAFILPDSIPAVNGRHRTAEYNKGQHTNRGGSGRTQQPRILIAENQEKNGKQRDKQTQF